MVWKSIWCGNQYGGFYVYINENINDEFIVYSFGIGEDISFDLEINERIKCKVFCFDPTPKSIAWVKNQNIPNSISFFEYGLSDENKETVFYLPQNKDYVSGSIVEHQNVNSENSICVQMKNLSTIMQELGHNHINILKMDIEGSEYNVIENILKSKISVDQILVEFHDRFFDDGRSKSEKIVEILKSNGYEIFNVSDSFEEVSFIKKQCL